MTKAPACRDSFWARIFDKFAQADSSDSRQKAGTGLGLSISKAIVESMNGKIDFESAPGDTTFAVTLAAWQGALNTRTCSFQNRVLIVEDDEDIAALIKLSLEQEGYCCDIAATAKSARELLARSTGYMAMTLDLLLPDADGIELIRELRQHEATIKLPIVVVSGHAHQGKKRLGGEAIGILGWLPKPIDLGHLKRLLATVRTDARTPQILYIEDDADIIAVISAALQDVAVVEAARSLRRARRLLRQRPFDLAILDVLLPDGSGLDLLPELAARAKPIPVIILSVAETSQDIQQRVTASMVKSVVPEEKVIETIKALIQRKEVA